MVGVDAQQGARRLRQLAAHVHGAGAALAGRPGPRSASGAAGAGGRKKKV
jgi:hypothetical protein